MTDLAALLAQAKEHRDAHDTNRWRMRPDGQYICENCGRVWPCPDRVFADAVIATLESLTTRDTQIRELMDGVQIDLDLGDAESLRRAGRFISAVQILLNRDFAPPAGTHQCDQCGETYSNRERADRCTHD